MFSVVQRGERRGIGVVVDLQRRQKSNRVLTTILGVSLFMLLFLCVHGITNTLICLYLNAGLKLLNKIVYMLGNPV